MWPGAQSDLYGAVHSDRDATRHDQTNAFGALGQSYGPIARPTELQLIRLRERSRLLVRRPVRMTANAQDLNSNIIVSKQLVSSTSINLHLLNREDR